MDQDKEEYDGHPNDHRIHQRSDSPGPGCDQPKEAKRMQLEKPEAINMELFLQEENLTKIKKALLKTLEGLLDDDFEKFKWHLQNLCNFPSMPKKKEKAKRTDTVDWMLETYSSNTVWVTRTVLVEMNRNDLVKTLSNAIQEAKGPKDEGCQHKLKSKLKKKFKCVFEGIAKAGQSTPLNKIYTEIHITEGGTGEVNTEHEVIQIESATRKPHRPETTIRPEDIFETPPGCDEPVNKVLTTGVAGIGKTVLTQKFTLDWAEDKSNQDIEFLFPLTFRELNLMKHKKFSLVQLVHHFFSDTEATGIRNFEDFQVVFILDGLDECRLSLDFHSAEVLTDVTESTSLGVLLTNFIRGTLLPSARLWITSRPAAADQIPADCVDRVTDIRGFTDSQKEEYFTKRFVDKEQASRIISHIKTSRSLFIMCYIPAFCWLTATVMENALKTGETGELPKTLTALFIRYVVVQAKLKNVKYDGKAATDSHWSPDTRTMIMFLGKLAFEQLQKGNQIFYESDLTEVGLNITAASKYSGVFTQIFKEESGVYQDKVFCFIHLTVQEFLAALHVHQTFSDSRFNLMTRKQATAHTSAETRFYHSAVNKTLQSPNGHLDLFLRFFLGLSVEANQNLLRGLLKQTGSTSKANSKTVEFITKKLNNNSPSEQSGKINENLSEARRLNLFYCLNELNDSSLVDRIQHYLRAGDLFTRELSHAQWSALAFILLSSEQDLDVFDLKKYPYMYSSGDTLVGLLPVVKASKHARLSGCYLSERSCEVLSSVLSSSGLRELDLANNDLRDSGVERLCVGLKRPDCKLETLSLSGCLITTRGCASLASALTSNLSHLRELDLSYNHLGDSGEKLLKDRLDDPQCSLTTLRMEPAGEQWLTPGLRKYSCELTVDMNTVNRTLKLSDNNRKVTYVEVEQPYSDHPDRFDSSPQLLCSNALTGRCYWEVQRKGTVRIAVSDRGISRKGCSRDNWFGQNHQSWSLECSDAGYSFRRPDMETVTIPSSLVSHGVAVYVDCPAGALSFYRVSPNRLIHLHTFNTTFTEPLYAGFALWSDDSSVTLRSL